MTLNSHHKSAKSIWGAIFFLAFATTVLVSLLLPSVSHTLEKPRLSPPPIAWRIVARDAGKHNQLDLLLAFVRSGYPDATEAACQVIRDLPLTDSTLPAFRELLYSSDTQVQYHGINALWDSVNALHIRGVTDLPHCPDYETFKKDIPTHVELFKIWLNTNYTALAEHTKTTNKKQ